MLLDVDNRAWTAIFSGHPAAAIVLRDFIANLRE